MLAIAAAAFVSIYLFAVPFPWIVLAAALIGVVGRYAWQAGFPAPASAATLQERDYLIDRRIARAELDPAHRSARRSIMILLICSVLWLAPLLAVMAMFGRASVFAQQGLLFSETALISFGGAYAVLAYVAQRAVETYAWLSAGEMLDGLALAETTPGPLIMVVQFVAYVAAFRQPGTLSPVAAGLLGAALTTWVTFVPCFLWIFLGAPYIEALRSNRMLHAAMSAITAAVVGVILNLSVWFAVHTMFQRVDKIHWGLLHVDTPQWSSWQPLSVLLAAAALVAMLRYKLGMGWTLLGSAVIGASYFLLCAGTA